MFFNIVVIVCFASISANAGSYRDPVDLPIELFSKIMGDPSLCTVSKKWCAAMTEDRFLMNELWAEKKGIYPLMIKALEKKDPQYTKTVGLLMNSVSLNSWTINIQNHINLFRNIDFPSLIQVLTHIWFTRILPKHIQSSEQTSHEAEMPTFLTNRVDYNESIINALLVLSSLFGMIELVSLLIQDFGAKFNYDNEQPLRLAAKYAHYKIVDYLIDKGSDIHVLNERVFTYICENGDIERIQWFIDNDVNVKVVGAIPLLTASREGNFDVVKILFENGAPLAYDHFSPFHAAIFNGHLSIVQYFFQVRHHLPINRGLISAARGGNIEVAEYLLTKGASINAFHNSPVIFAAENCRAEMVQFLLKGYISPHLRFFGRLFRQSVDINAQDGRVLDGAIRIMCIPVVKVLVNAGINPEFTKRAYLKIQSGFYNIDHFQLNANYNTDRERIAKILEKYNESL